MKTRAIIALAALALLACETKKTEATTEATPTAEAEATKPEAAKDEVAEASDPAKQGASTKPIAPTEEAAPATPPAAAEADPSAWPETFGEPDTFDEASGEIENEEGDSVSVTKVVFGLERMTAKDTKAALDMIKPSLDALNAKEKAKNSSVWEMPSYDALVDTKSFTTRAYPVGPDAVFVLTREVVEEDDGFEHQVPKAALIYDTKRGEIVYHLGLHDWKRSDSFSKHDVGGVPMMRVGYDSEGGQCAAGGKDEIYAVLPGGVKKVLEREWDLTTHADATGVAVMKSGVVKISSQPAVKKNRKKETFVTNKVEETCRFSNGTFTCVEKVVEKGVVTPGCF